MNNKKTNTTLSAIAARFTALLLILTMASCTLSMEDWVETEENKGYDELVTEENDFYSVKYQYKDYTRSITDQIREYIVSVEADSVIYFLDNLPEEWTPQVGGCVVSNCCTMFPMGLIGRVLDVRKEAGMIKVTTTPCELKDAYEDFELDLDMDVVSSKNPQMKNVTRSACPKTRGVDSPDSIISTIDWTMFNLTSKDEKVRCVDGIMTRADDDDYFDEDVNTDTTYTTETVILSMDNDTEPLKSFMKKYKKFIDKAEIEISHVSKVNLRKVVKLKSDYEYSKQTEISGLKLSAVIGKGKMVYEYDPKEKSKTESARRLDEFVTSLIESGDIVITDRTPVKEQIKNDLMFLCEIPLGSLPFGIIFRLKPIAEFEVALIGCGETTFWLAKTETEVTISNGEKYEKEPKKSSPPANEWAVSLGGTFDLSLGFEAFLGIGKKVGVGTAIQAYGVGAFCSCTASLSGELNWNLLEDGSFDGSVEAGIAFTGDIEIGGKALGGRWGEYVFAKKSFRIWEGELVNLHPRVQVDGQMPVVYEENSKGKTKKVTVCYSYPRLGIYATALSSYYYPRLRVYRGTEIEHNTDYVDLHPMYTTSHVLADTKYYFQFETSDVDEEFTAVPMLYYKNGKETYTLFPDNKAYIGKDRLPLVKYYTCYDKSVNANRMLFLHKSEELKEDDPLYYEIASSSGQKLYSYEFCLPFRIYNASQMKDYWSDFGIKYMVDLNSAEGRYISLFNKIQKSKSYVPRIRVVTDKKFDYLSNNYVEATLYYVNKNDPNKEKRYFDTKNDWMFCWKKYAKYNNFVDGADYKLYNRAYFQFQDEPTEWGWELDVSKNDFVNINN